MGIQEKVEVEMSQCPQHNESMDIEPRLLLQTLLDWEDDYVPPAPHVFRHQNAENCFERGSKSVLNSTRFDVMRELGNILKVISATAQKVSVWSFGFDV